MAPEITKPLEKQYDILYATDKTLVCEATGGPTPVITWYRDGAPVVNGDNINVEGGVLKFTSAVKDLNGEYKCVAKNRKDEATTSTKINVYCKCSSPTPNFKEITVVITCDTRGPVSLLCIRFLSDLFRRVILKKGRCKL